MERRALGKLRTALLEQRDELLEKIRRVEGDLEWLDASTQSERVEEGQEGAMAEVLEVLDERERAELAAVDRALARLGDGGAGICMDCGEQIAAARLRAMPHADLCLRCAAAREGSAAPKS